MSTTTETPSTIPAPIHLQRDDSPFRRGSIDLKPVLLPDSAPVVTVRPLIPLVHWRGLVADATAAGCCYCGGRHQRGSVALHEQWRFDDGLQHLVCLTPVCPACHLAVAWDCTRIRHLEEVVTAHACRVNQWPIERWTSEVQIARRRRREQREIAWVFDEVDFKRRLANSPGDLLQESGPEIHVASMTEIAFSTPPPDWKAKSGVFRAVCGLVLGRHQS